MVAAQLQVLLNVWLDAVIESKLPALVLICCVASHCATFKSVDL